MLDLKYNEKIHLDKWDIDVKPYLTLEEISLIIKSLKNESDIIERQKMLIADILVSCTDLYNNKEKCNYTYEEILYSGFFNDLLEACPTIQENIHWINLAIQKELGIDSTIKYFIDYLTTYVNNIDPTLLSNYIDKLNIEGDDNGRGNIN